MVVNHIIEGANARGAAAIISSIISNIISSIISSTIIYHYDHYLYYYSNNDNNNYYHIISSILCCYHAASQQVAIREDFNRDVFCFTEQDDLFLPDTVQKASKVIRQHPRCHLPGSLPCTPWYSPSPKGGSEKGAPTNKPLSSHVKVITFPDPLSGSPFGGRWNRSCCALQYGRFPKFHRVRLGRDPGTLKSDIVSKKHPQLICSDLRLSNWKFEGWNHGNRLCLRMLWTDSKRTPACGARRSRRW